MKKKTAMMTEQIHPFAPIYDKYSKVLILGSFPSVKSRETAFYYGHPSNRFWKVTAAVMGCAVPETAEEKKAFLLQNGIAVWDVIRSCKIEGSSDSSIKDAVPNDFGEILRHSSITHIFANGALAAKIYNDHKISRVTGIEIITLPSTSPANAAYNVERLCEHWRQIAEYCKG